VPPPLIESAVYAFEGLLPDLESPPIAARRALDHAGIRLPLEGWRSLSIEERQRVTFAGLPERVDAELVAGLLRRANPGPQRVAPVVDPDPSAAPEAMVRALEPGRAIDPKRWARLRAVDRYALAHTYRRAVARSAFSLLGEAFDAVLAANAPAPEAPPATQASGRQTNAYRPAGFYSTVETPPEPRDAVPVSTRKPATYSSPPPYPYPSPLPPRAHEGGSRSPGHGSIPPPPGGLSNHLTTAGEVRMVDVGKKPQTERRAVARGSVVMHPETLARLQGRDAPKGEVLATARLAAIMAAKRTHELVPLCHPVALTHVEVLLDLDVPGSSVHVTVVAGAFDRTGCEMEAMVAVTAACLTVYDMLKGIDREMVITEVKLLEKMGGRSGHFKRSETKP
jgi:cyclic pyranopterin monophosphate synthase